MIKLEKPIFPTMSFRDGMFIKADDVYDWIDIHLSGNKRVIDLDKETRVYRMKNKHVWHGIEYPDIEYDQTAYIVGKEQIQQESPVDVLRELTEAIDNKCFITEDMQKRAKAALARDKE